MKAKTKTGVSGIRAANPSTSAPVKKSTTTVKKSKPAAQKDTSKTHINCADCGNKLGRVRRCARCLKAAYCGPSCQKAHWKSHEETCKRGTNPCAFKEGFGPSSLPKPDEKVYTKEYGSRLVLIIYSSNMLHSCCFNCGILLFHPMSDTVLVPHMVDDPFPGFARMSSREMTEKFDSMQPNAAAQLMTTCGYSGDIRYIRTDPGELGPKAKLSACLWCARIMKEMEAGEEKRANFMLAWQRFGAVTAFDHPLGDMSIVERRPYAPAALFADPDISKGPGSVAGRVLGEKDRKITFDFHDVKSLAFPNYFWTREVLSTNAKEVQASWDAEMGIDLKH